MKLTIKTIAMNAISLILDLGSATITAPFITQIGIVRDGNRLVLHKADIAAENACEWILDGNNYTLPDAIGLGLYLYPLMHWDDQSVYVLPGEIIFDLSSFPDDVRAEVQPGDLCFYCNQAEPIEQCSQIEGGVTNYVRKNPLDP